MEKENKKAITAGVLGLAGGLVLGYYLGGSPDIQKKLDPVLEKLKKLTKEYEKSDLFNEERVKKAIHKLLCSVLNDNDKEEANG